MFKLFSIFLIIINILFISSDVFSARGKHKIKKNPPSKPLNTKQTISIKNKTTLKDQILDELENNLYDKIDFQTAKYRTYRKCCK